jgi:hypothetical protein
VRIWALEAASERHSQAQRTRAHALLAIDANNQKATPRLVSCTVPMSRKAAVDQDQRLRGALRRSERQPGALGEDSWCRV